MRIPLISKDGVFSAQLQFAIEHYIDTRDQAKAALLARMEPTDFIRAMRHPKVKAEIQRKLDLIDLVSAEFRASARKLTADKLDTTLVEVLDNDDPKAVMAKVKAIEVGYKRYGMLTEKREVTGENGAPLAFELVRIGVKKKVDDGQE